jgi:carboxylesterase
MTHPIVMPGAEPFELTGGRTGVLVCHGFTGSTQSVRDLGQALHAAGCTVVGPRLAGHGTTPEDMATTGAQDWIASVNAALAQLRERCDKVFMAGLSMGGVLTLYSAAMHGEAIAGIVTINAPLTIGSPDLAGLALNAAAPTMIPGVGSDIKAPGVRELAYEQLPVAALRQLYTLTAVTRDLLPRVRCPALVMQSREDHLVQSANASSIAALLGSDQVQLHWLNNSFHVATLDLDKGLIERRVVDFVRSL